jgi:hypothetical protein
MERDAARAEPERLLDVEDRPLSGILAELVEELEPPLYVVRVSQEEWDGSTLVVHQDGVELLSTERGREQGMIVFKRRSLPPLHGLRLEERTGFSHMYADRGSWYDGATVSHDKVGTFEVTHRRSDDDDEALQALIKMLRDWARKPPRES